MTTAALFLANITNAIAALTISGVTIKDIDEVVGSWIQTPNVLYPNMDDFVTNFAITYPTFVQDGTGPVDVDYTLNYRFLSTQVGDLATVPVQFGNIMTKAIAIANALLVVRAPYDGRILMSIGSIAVGARNDPAGNQYFGADIPLNIQEIQN